MAVFGKHLRELRNQEGLSQEKLSKRIGISKSSINMFERGEREPGFDALGKISSYYGVPLDFLLERPPFEAWDVINSNRKGFFYYVPIKNLKKEKIKLIWGIDIDDPYSASIQSMVRFISDCIESVDEDEDANLIIKLKKNYEYLTEDQLQNVAVPTITEDTVTFPVIGEMAAGYDSIALEDWRGETVEIPMSYLKGHAKDEYIVLSVKGDSMYPVYHEGDRVLVLRQEDVPFSGAVGAVRYSDELVTLKIVEKRTDTSGDAYIRLKPINPQYPPLEIRGEDLDHYAIIGIPKLLIRDIEE